MTDAPRVLGFEDVTKELKEIPDRLKRRVLGKAFRKGARIIAAQAKSDAPRGETGALRHNLISKKGSRRYNNGLEARYIIGVRHGKVRTEPTTYKTKSGKVKTRKLTAYDKRGEDPFYYRFQELGFKAGGKTYVPGKRFLTNALVISARRATDTVVAETRTAIQQGALKK